MNPHGGVVVIIVIIVPKDVTLGAFRMRAEAESKLPVAKPSAGGMLLPDLKAVPPYEFTFVAPANPANGANENGTGNGTGRPTPSRSNTNNLLKDTASVSSVSTRTAK